MSILRTKGTVSTYRSMFKYYTMLGNVMVGTAVDGIPLAIRLREKDYAE